MENKYKSIDMIEEMAKVKKNFRLLLIANQHEIIEGMLADMSQEEKDILLRLYIYEDLSQEEKTDVLRLFANGHKH